MIRVAVAGAAGRMGKTILGVCRDSDDVAIGAAVEHADSPALGMDAGEQAGIGRQDVTIVSDIDKVMDDFDVLIDFTLADAVADNVEKCRAAGKKMVIGTTGLADEQRAAINKAGRDIAIVFAPNMSSGVNLVFRLAQLAARAIGADTDIEIIEAHHNQKKDAPSGTAVRLGEIIASELGRDLKDCAVYGREGHTGVRDPDTIGFETIRAGDIVGDHTVLFAGTGERVEITHRASSRKTFAVGAVRAARWIMDRDRGVYDMQDVLGLNDA
jgi:4-hydroxy-tetrahydrodipicolinate reductase